MLSESTLRKMRLGVAGAGLAAFLSAGPLFGADADGPGGKNPVEKPPAESPKQDGHAKELRAKLEAETKRLADEDFDTREAAVKKLVELGKAHEAVLPWLKKEAAKNEDPEAGKNLGRVLAALEPKQEEPLPPRVWACEGCGKG